MLREPLDATVFLAYHTEVGETPALMDDSPVELVLVRDAWNTRDTDRLLLFWSGQRVARSRVYRAYIPSQR